MFPATLTLTVDTVAKNLLRVNQDNYGSEYQLNGATESINLKIRHTSDSRDGDGIIMKRHNVFVEHIVYPTPTTALQKYTYTVTLRHGEFNGPGPSVDLGKALNAWLGTSTNFAGIGAGEN
nr:MAG: hypothetical protein 2 [Leviviridae sp.]